MSFFLIDSQRKYLRELMSRFVHADPLRGFRGSATFGGGVVCFFFEKTAYYFYETRRFCYEFPSSGVHFSNAKTRRRCFWCYCC